MCSNAQSSVNTSGNTATGNSGNTTYSIGQLVYTTQTGTSGATSNGVQQPSEISIVLSMIKNEHQLKATAFPNPTIDFLKLDIKGVEFSNLKYRITDINGKTITANRITKQQTHIPMQNLTTATYFVTILKKNKNIKTFKIFKQ